MKAILMVTLFTFLFSGHTLKKEVKEKKEDKISYNFICERINDGYDRPRNIASWMNNHCIKLEII